MNKITLGRTINKCLITKDLNYLKKNRSETVLAPSLQIAPLYRPEKTGANWRLGAIWRAAIWQGLLYRKVGLKPTRLIF